MGLWHTEGGATDGREDDITDQPTFSDLDFQVKKGKTRREEFLEKQEGLVPWQRLEESIRPHYFSGQRGRRPYPLSVMLRVHIV